MARPSLFALVLCAAVSTQCSETSRASRRGARGTLNEPLSSGRGHNPREHFLKELETWTRKDKIYQGLDNKLFISATYHAPDFRRAFAIAFPDIYGHGGKITRRELVDMTGGVEQHHNFFIATYTPNVHWNDFSRDESIWRISLYSKSMDGEGTGEAEVSPDAIIPLKIDENLRAVYPYISRFDKIYLVRFPLRDAWQRPVVDSHTSEVVLRVASALGVANMRWPMRALQDGSQGVLPDAAAH